MLKEIELTLTIDEANLVLEALGALPFARVFQLVAKIQEQAGPQVRPADRIAETDAAEPRHVHTDAPVGKIGGRPDGD